MPAWYFYRCESCDYKAERYCNVRRCPKCGNNLIRISASQGSRVYPSKPSSSTSKVLDCSKTKPLAIEQRGVIKKLHGDRYCGPQTLSFLVFSDCRRQDISILIEFVRTLRSKPDLILYAGDDIDRFRPNADTNYFELLANEATYGLCCVIGNDNLPEVRSLIQGHRVYDVHKQPVCLGKFFVLGIEGAPKRPGEPDRGCVLYPESTIKRRLLAGLRGGKDHAIIVLSHTPPCGVLDRAIRFGNRSIGSDALAEVLKSSGDRIPLVVCGHVHSQGGRSEQVGKTVVVNAASHDSRGQPLRVGLITLGISEVQTVEWKDLAPERIARDPRSVISPPAMDRWVASELQRVDGIGWKRRRQLEAVGIATLAQLIAATPSRLAKILRLPVSTAETLIVRARAVYHREPIPLGPCVFPSGERIYLDIETDLAQQWMWLVGCYADRNNEFVSFSTKRRCEKDELAMLKEFIAYLSEYPNAILISYSGTHLDRRVILLRLHYFSLPAPARNQFIDAL